MPISEIAQFIFDRIEEDRARIAGWDSDGRARIAVMWTGGEPGYTTVASDHADGRWCADGHVVEERRHITVLFDAQRALHDLWVKRKITELHLGNTVEYPPRFDEFDPQWVAVCIGCHEHRRRNVAGCETLRLIAQNWMGHPEWRDEWKR